MKLKWRNVVLNIMVALLSGFVPLQAQTPATGKIYFNQLGFYPVGPKVAIVEADTAQDFQLLAAETRKVVFSGPLSALRNSAYSPLSTRIADFSAFKVPGRYYLVVAGAGASSPFTIGNQLQHQLSVSALKAFYYQRASMPLDAVYAGPWARKSGHPDTAVLIHPSAASKKRPAGSTVNVSGGWYDAGDYNKYIVNSGISTGTLLSSYEDFPAYFDTLKTNIPAGPARVPDILVESLYNIRWMLLMQDPADGGVYNKCTNLQFDGMVMPDQALAPRYVVQKGTAATLNLAAVAAQAARIFKKYPDQYPGLADSCLSAAARAWQWAIKNPDVAYDQELMNKKFNPPVLTGGYGDSHFQDEWLWAAAELYASTLQPLYNDAVLARLNDPVGLPGWNYVGILGYYSLLRNQQALPASSKGILSILKKRILSIADSYLAMIPSSTLNTVMGAAKQDFIWGSNTTAANQGVLLVNAFLLSSDLKYLNAALGNLDYLLGRNATGYCFVTGTGFKSPMHPHHRPSIADGIILPVPGLLVGGPNFGQQDHAAYSSSDPERSYIDLDEAYACNEIAINWNAPLVYLSNALEALQHKWE